MSEEWKTASYIRSHEIGDYLYCNRQWFLKRVEGVQPAPFKIKQMKKGDNYHEQHWKEVKKAARNEQVILALIAAAVTLIVLFMLWEYAP